MKIIAFYLPQFHCFKENELWWGKGFTEWTNVKGAKALFEGHIQPRIPLHKNYYNLLDVNTIKYQTELAKRYGVYGFCYYHYWFSGKLLMEKPMEILLQHTEIDFPFCISWANETWTKTWDKKKKKILIEQQYGNKEEWKQHFEYLYKFLSDSRYICIDGKPLLIIYRPELIKDIEPMLKYWNSLAADYGLPGISFAYQHRNYNHLKAKSGYLFDYGIEYQPLVSKFKQMWSLRQLISKALNVIYKKLNIPPSKLSCITIDYDKTWRNILSLNPRDEKMIPGAFVNWDNTPRYRDRGSLYTGYTVKKFEAYLTRQIRRAKEVYHKDMLFLFAWNEWGEGGFLEPDEEEKFSRLEAVKNALEECEELE